MKENRIRSRAYMAFVRTHPCLSCGAQAEAHHIQFAQARAKSMKVGDNWTVPLCHPCHMELHAMGDERTWWDLRGIDPLQWATEKWNEYGERH